MCLKTATILLIVFKVFYHKIIEVIVFQVISGKQINIFLFVCHDSTFLLCKFM